MTYTHYPAGPRGADGLDGEPAGELAVAGREGEAGARTIVARPLAASPVALPPALLESLLDRAELSFINEQVKNARAKLTWLLGLLPPLQDDAGMYVGRYHGRGEATTALGKVAYAPDPLRR